MKHIKKIIFFSFLILAVIFFYAEIAPEIKRINDNNKKIEELNQIVHDEMNQSFKNYEY